MGIPIIEIRGSHNEIQWGYRKYPGQHLQVCAMYNAEAEPCLLSIITSAIFVHHTHGNRLCTTLFHDCNPLSNR